MTGSKYFCCWPLLWWTDRRKVNTHYTLPPCIQFVNLDQQSVGATLEPATILSQEIWAPKNWFKIRHWQQTSPQTTSAEKRYPSGQSLEIMERGGKKCSNWAPHPHSFQHHHHMPTLVTAQMEYLATISKFSVVYPPRPCPGLHTYCIFNSCIYMDTYIPLIIRITVYSDLIETPQLEENDPTDPENFWIK